jgi:hypothetical protein
LVNNKAGFGGLMDELMDGWIDRWGRICFKELLSDVQKLCNSFNNAILLVP